MQKTENIPIEKEIIIYAGIVKINTTSTEFNELLNKITKKNAIKITEESCKKLLANPNTETYSYEIEE